MKTKLLFLICWAVAGLFYTLPAQTTSKCYDFACMMQKARTYIQEKNFEAALKSVTAAKRYSKANEPEADALIEEIFQEIIQLRIQAEEATATAKKATRAAEISAKLAEEERQKALKAEAQARQQRDSVITARALVEELINKGKALETTFSDTSTYDYLYQKGLEYFQWNQIEQSRDYLNALTYFALARFLKPSNTTLDYLVIAAKTGIAAETDFINGELEQAQKRYDTIRTNVTNTSQIADFEAWRMAQIEEVEGLYLEFRKKNDVHTSNPDTLEGNWWTVPSDFQQYQEISSLIFKNNPATFRPFPAVLGALPRLKNLALINCPAVRRPENWEKVPRLQALVLKDNANLYSLKQLEKITQLNALDIDNCPALTHIEGCEQLEFFSIKNSPQARVSTLLQTNEQLKKLELADIELPAATFNSEQLQKLEFLRLSRMDVFRLNGLEKNALLRELNMDHLNQLQRFTPPRQLTSASVSNCGKLVALDSWPQSDSLNKLVLYENDALKSPPDWTRFPQLKHLLIQNNNALDSIKGIKSIRSTERLFILNNTKLMTNSVHAGFGFEWGVDLSSVKVEFEHRQTIRWLKGADIGVKFLGAYVRKKFEDDALYTKRETKGYLMGFFANYYSPFRVYAGLGLGLGHIRSLFSDLSLERQFNFVWINQLGYQFAPYFLKKDKMSLNMDLYTIFEKGDYFILPSFGLTYYHTLDFNKKTYFIRPGDSRRHIVQQWRPFRKSHKQRTDTLQEQF